MKLTKKILKGYSKNQLIEIILVQQQTIEIQGKRIQELEERVARLEKNSTTSSKPPSSDDNKPPRNQSLREKSGRKPGGQKGHTGHTRAQEKEPDEVKECLPEAQCKKCGSDLDFEQAKVTETRQEIEIPPIKPHVIEYQKVEIECQALKTRPLFLDFKLQR